MFSALHDEPVWDDDGPSVPAEDPRPKVTLKACPKVRSRLHVICALYAHTPSVDRRLALLDHLEQLTLEAAEMLAADLLARGWRPPVSAAGPAAVPSV